MFTLKSILLLYCYYLIQFCFFGSFFRKDELFGKEVLDADIQIVGKVSDVVLDKDTYEITDLVLKKTGFSEQIKASENLVPMELVKVIGDKILLKGEDDL